LTLNGQVRLQEAVKVDCTQQMMAKHFDIERLMSQLDLKPAVKLSSLENGEKQKLPHLIGSKWTARQLTLAGDTFRLSIASSFLNLCRNGGCLRTFGEVLGQPER